MTSSISCRLHDAAAPIWEACLKHPFVTGIGDGILAVENFMRQDLTRPEIVTLREQLVDMLRKQVTG